MWVVLKSHYGSGGTLIARNVLNIYTNRETARRAVVDEIESYKVRMRVEHLTDGESRAYNPNGSIHVLVHWELHYPKD